MKSRFLLFIGILCVLIAGTVGSLMAQDVGNKRIGTAAGSELLIPVGARDMAMGGASIATSWGIDAIYWNPAGLSRMTGSAEAMLSTMSYIADIRVNYGAVGLKFGGFGTVGFSIKALDVGDILLTTTDDPEGLAGRTFSPSIVVLGLSYARSFTDAITAGGNLKLISENMQRVTGSGFAIDVGIQYHGVAGFKGVQLGVALKNVGPQMSFDGPGLLRLAEANDSRRPTQYFQTKAASWELPTTIELGLAYTRDVGESVNYNFSGSYTNNNLALDSYKVGGEVMLKMSSLTLAGRGGIELLDKGAQDDQIFGPTAGFGFTYKTPGIDLGLDFAYRSVDFFDSNQMFSLRLGF
jgi:hypothetical protein